MSCDELTLKATDWPTEILRVVGVKARPLVVIVPAGATVVVVVGATVVAGAAVVAGATVVAGAVVVGATVVAGAHGLAT